MATDLAYERLQQRLQALEREILEQKKTSQSLQKELKDEVIRRRILVEQSRDGIVVVDQNARVVETNRKFAAMLGYPVEKMHQFHVWDWDIQWTPEQIKAMIHEVDVTGDHFETRHRRKDGSCYDAEISTNGAVFEGRKLVFCVCRDITDRKNNEAALKDSEERFRRLFEEAPIAIQGYFPDGTIHYWNQASIETYQYTKEEAIGKNLIELIIPPKMRNMVSAAVKQGVETGEMPLQDEISLMRKDGTLVPVLSSHVAIKRRSKATELFCIDIDLTELKLLQAELQQAHKLEAIGTLTGGIAHDFNNILGIILGNCELALEDVPPSNPARISLEEINTASLRAKGIVEQLVSYCLKTKQERKPMRLVPVLKDIIKFIRATIPTTIDIRLVIQATDDTILSDPNLIYQVMMNLCRNALQAMEKTGGTIIIHAENIAEDQARRKPYHHLAAGKYIRISVNDTGQGIAPEIIDHIFDPYFTTKEVDKGSGMGLTVVRGIVQKHEGKIFVESHPKMGTTFTVVLPIIEKLPET